MFGKKVRNKRNEREQVLEVRMRARDARRWRLRVITALVGVIGGTLIAAVVVWQAYRWAMRKLVYDNTAYAVRRIELRHEGRLRPEQIRAWSGITAGQNLLALDLERVRQELEMNPWIERADVETLRPDRVRLTIRERDPVAQVVVWRFSPVERSAWAETNYVEPGGMVLPPLRPEWVRSPEMADLSHLPRLVGLEQTAVIPGRTLRYPGISAGLALLAAYERSAIYSLVDLKELDVSSGLSLHGRLSTGTRVVFGASDFDRQLRRWGSIHAYAGSLGRDLDWLDLSVTNNVPARWRESTNAVPAPPVKKPKPNPRRHV